MLPCKRFYSKSRCKTHVAGGFCTLWRCAHVRHPKNGAWQLSWEFRSKRSMQMSVANHDGCLLSFNRIKMIFKKFKIVTFTSCAFFCRSCRQHKWLLLNVHDADSLSRTLCDQGVYCYYTGRKHLPVAGSPDAPVGFIKCVVGRVSQGILKKGMCDLYKFCV